jgi:hypothetical protein
MSIVVLLLKRQQGVQDGRENKGCGDLAATIKYISKPICRESLYGISRK